MYSKCILGFGLHPLVLPISRVRPDVFFTYTWKSPRGCCNICICYNTSPIQHNACRMKKGNKRFWRACNQIFGSKPYSPWKIINIDAFEDSNGQQLMIWQSLQPTGIVGRVISKNYGEISFYIQTMRLMVELYARQLFFPFFLQKK